MCEEEPGGWDGQEWREHEGEKEKLREVRGARSESGKATGTTWRLLCARWKSPEGSEQSSDKG